LSTHTAQAAQKGKTHNKKLKYYTRILKKQKGQGAGVVKGGHTQKKDNRLRRPNEAQRKPRKTSPRTTGENINENENKTKKT